MAIPTAVIAAIPWKQIIEWAPDVSNAASAIWDKWASKPKPEPIDLKANISVQVKEISERIQTLETNEKNQVEIINQLAVQIQSIAQGLKETAEKQAFLFKIAMASILISVSALLAAGIFYLK